MVKSAKEDLIMDINAAAEELGEDATAIDLTKRIFENQMKKGIDPIEHALNALKGEISQTY